MTHNQLGTDRHTTSHDTSAAAQLHVRPPVSTLIARSFSATAALLALLVTVVGGAIAPGHSHAANYISELGARGAAHGEVVSLAGFLPIGLASFVALVASARLENQ